MKSWPFIILVASLILSGCASFRGVDPGAELPAMPSYTKDFRMKFADEIDVVCGNKEKNMDEEYPYTCIFVQDAIVLRAQLKAIKKLN